MASYESHFSSIFKEAQVGIERENLASARDIERRMKRDIPKATGHTAEGIEIDKISNGYIVLVPFPGHLIEYGTVKMAPRPFAGPAAEIERPDHIENIRKVLNESG